MRNSLMFFPMAAIVCPAYAVDYLSIEQAQQVIFGETVSSIATPLALDDDQRDLIKDLAGVRQRQDTQPIWKIEQNGQQVGWLFMDDVIGKHEYITYALGVNMAGEVVGMEILSYRETHGGEVREAEWRGNFAGKTVDQPFKLDEDIPNISGATLSCRNLTDGVKRLLVIQQQFLAASTS